MQTSATIHELALALSKCQGEMQQARLSKDNPFFKSKYADLAEIWDTIRKPLTDNELSIIQMPSTNNGDITITTRLLHSSGEWIEESLSLKPTKLDPQGMGSAITYGRRYALSAFLGVSADDDDDGNGCSISSKSKDAKPEAPKNDQEFPSGWENYTQGQKLVYNKKMGTNFK